MLVNTVDKQLFFGGKAGIVLAEESSWNDFHGSATVEAERLAYVSV